MSFAFRSTVNFFLLCGIAFFLQEARPEVISSNPTASQPVLAPLANEFSQVVGNHLTVPETEAIEYAALLNSALASEEYRETMPKFIVLVDRNPNVQALLLYWGTISDGWTLVGAASVSTGLPGRYEHFKTPLGVFEHSRTNPDFRAEGTKNKFGIRGYGAKGDRIYDFGWVKAPRGWGDGHMGELRLQMHSTDHDLLEQRLGTAQSEGCVRVPAPLNQFLDLYGILDEDYDRAIATGTHLWLLRTDRMSTPWSGRFLVVVESTVATRPAWAGKTATRH